MDSVAMQKELDKMNLLEEKEIGNVKIQKVTGGWIYWKIGVMGSVSISVSGVFVPEK